ncbi:MAG: 2Fe-2S iron-sulfur cluster-binding protein [Candidatus Latescibacteria bacterium]|jgi:[NiFe] hydrogenase diaphorase moiety small subunit|nr:2Fe-2S iron-sulfur cluster-binding protein [Candidatus Latescibacterota bacterium]
MSSIKFTLDGVTIEAEAEQTIMEAADAAGVYIPRLCAHPELKPYGSCRVCTVLVNGRPQSSCTQPVSEGLVVENESEAIQRIRRNIIEMLFVEGNHYCMFCEKSGNCELQAIGYRFGITAPRYAFQFPEQDIDASHPEVFVDRNRCILCARCVRASRDIDGKQVFQFVGRGPRRCLGVNSAALLKDTDIDVTDKALDICPVGALMKKHVGYHTPVGERLYDIEPIGSDIEARGKAETT